MAVAASRINSMYQAYSETPETIWLDPKRRDAAAEYYVWWKGLDEAEQKAAISQSRKQKEQNPEIAFKEISKSFKEFVNSEPTIVQGSEVTPLKKLTRGEGENKTLAKFLAIDEIYALVDPLSALTNAADRKDEDDIEVMVFFMISNYNSIAKQGVTHSLDEMFISIMVRYSAEEERRQVEEAHSGGNKTYIPGILELQPRDKAGMDRQRKFATVAVNILLKKRNNVSEDVLAKMCVRAGFNNLTTDIKRSDLKNLLIKLAHHIATTLGFNPPNVRPVTRTLQREFDRILAEEKEEHEVKASSTEKPQVATPEKAILWPTKFFDREALAAAKRKLAELRRQKKIEKATSSPYAITAKKVLALALLRDINLDALKPYIQEKSKWVEGIKRDNEKIESQDPFTRTVFHPTPTDDIDIPLEALMAARLEAARLKEEGKTVPSELEKLLEQLEAVFKELMVQDIETDVIVLDFAKKIGISLDSLSPYIKIEEDQPVFASTDHVDTPTVTALKKARLAADELTILEKTEATLESKDKDRLGELRKEIPPELPNLLSQLGEISDHLFPIQKRMTAKPKQPPVQKVDSSYIQKIIRSLSASSPIHKSESFELIRASKDDFYYVETKKSVGRGAYGEVSQAYKVNSRTGEFLPNPQTVKKIPAALATEDRIKNEVAAANKNRPTQAVRIANYRQNEDHYLLFSPYEPGATLLSGKKCNNSIPDTVRELNLIDRSTAVVDLLAQIAVLHHAGYGHFDINSKNILVHNNHNGLISTKLIDNGASRRVPKDSTKTIDVPTTRPYYLMPEGETPSKDMPQGLYFYRSGSPAGVSVLIVHDPGTQETLNLSELAKKQGGQEALEALKWPERKEKPRKTIVSRSLTNLIESNCAYSLSKLLTHMESGAPESRPSAKNTKVPCAGLNSDIFSVTPYVILLLCGESALSHRNEIYRAYNQKIESKISDQHKIQDLKEQQRQQLANTGFNDEGLLSDFGLPEELVELVKQFTQRMQDMDYEKRPDVDTCLKFFITFKSLIDYCTLESESNYDRQDPGVQDKWNELVRLAKEGGQLEVVAKNEEAKGRRTRAFELRPERVNRQTTPPLAMSTPLGTPQPFDGGSVVFDPNGELPLSPILPGYKDPLSDSDDLGQYAPPPSPVNEAPLLPFKQLIEFTMRSPTPRLFQSPRIPNHGVTPSQALNVTPLEQQQRSIDEDDVVLPSERSRREHFREERSPVAVTPLKGEGSPVVVTPLKGESSPVVVTPLKGEGSPVVVTPLKERPLDNSALILSLESSRIGYGTMFATPNKEPSSQQKDHEQSEQFTPQ